MKVRLLNLNTHVGDALKPKRNADVGLWHLKKKWNPDVVTVQEVQRPWARMRLKIIFPRLTWMAVGFMPPSIGLGAPGAIVLAKRSKFTKAGKTNRPLTSQLFVNGVRDKWHPSRRVISITLKFKKKDEKGNKKKFAVGSDHAWTAAGHPLNMNSVIANTHKHQINQFAGDAQKSLKDETVSAALRAGDYNEGISPADRQVYVERTFASVGLHTARPARDTDLRLDEVFVSSGVRVTGYHVISRKEGNTDHEGLVVDVEI